VEVEKIQEITELYQKKVSRCRKKIDMEKYELLKELYESIKNF